MPYVATQVSAVSISRTVWECNGCGRVLVLLTCEGLALERCSCWSLTTAGCYLLLPLQTLTLQECCRLRAQLAAEHRQQRYILTCCQPATAPSMAGDNSSNGGGSSSGSSESRIEEASPASVRHSADLPPLGSAGSVLLLRRAAILREQRLLQQVRALTLDR